MSRALGDLAVVEDVGVLADRIGTAVGACVGVFVLLIVLTVAVTPVVGGGPTGPPTRVALAISGVSLLAVLGLAWWVLEPEERAAAFPLRAPSVLELGWTILALPLGVLAFGAGLDVAGALGFEYVPLEYDLTDPVTLAVVVFATVLVAPVAEEALYRGLLFGALAGRTGSVPVAALLTIVVFGALHVHLGVAGTIAIAAWTAFPTLLRIRFDNLAGAMVLHFLNNFYAYILVPLVPALSA